MNSAPIPELSVVIATYNRREHLRRCLQALEAQTQDPSTFEVVIADDGSSDGTAEMAEGLDTALQIRALRLENGGWASAANAGARAARGRICLHIDDDIIASPELVAEHIAAHRGEAKTVAIGRLIQKAPDAPGWFGRAYTAAWNQRFEELGERPAEWPDCYGANLSAPREALVEASGFSTDRPTVADIELAYRLRQDGCLPVYLPRAEALHVDEKSDERILRDIGGYGGFCAEFTERHPSTRFRLLGWFGDATPRESLLRRLLLTLRVSPKALPPLGGLIPVPGARQVWYGFIARYCFWLGVRRQMSRQRWRQSTRGVPVLMYHAFTDSGERDRFVMPARSFRSQLRLLSALRYRVIPLQDLARALRDGEPLPKRTAVITIDDGYADNASIAQPILHEHGFPATVFLVSGKLGERNDWDTHAGSVTKDRPLLSITEVKEMCEDGIAVGAHTRTHLSLAGAPEGDVREQVEGSRTDLEAALGEPVDLFAYPYGSVDEQAFAAVAGADFLGACTTAPKHAVAGSDPVRIPRLEIEGTDTTARFLRKLWFGDA
ncbi:MAG: glycosyltransferase [Solirubrobacterales bacterium]